MIASVDLLDGAGARWTGLRRACDERLACSVLDATFGAAACSVSGLSAYA